MTTIFDQLIVPAQQTRIELFEEIFLIFLVLGTLVGIVVIAYTLYNAYKYRDTADTEEAEDRPTVGELPVGGTGGKKLFVSFLISAIIVISLIIWSYGVLLDVEEGPENPDIEVEVTGDGFAWFFDYGDGVQSTNTMVVPEDEPVWIETTGGDVWHTFGIADLRVKADAIPGEYDETWFVAPEAGEEYTIECFELCGELHSEMDGTVQVVTEEEYAEWYQNQLPDEETDDANNETDTGDDE